MTALELMFIPNISPWSNFVYRNYRAFRCLSASGHLVENTLLSNHFLAGMQKPAISGGPCNRFSSLGKIIDVWWRSEWLFLVLNDCLTSSLTRCSCFLGWLTIGITATLALERLDGTGLQTD